MKRQALWLLLMGLTLAAAVAWNTWLWRSGWIGP
jgi:hypothetical protein